MSWPSNLRVATTGVPDFFTATRFLGWDWFLRISSRLSASASQSAWVFVDKFFLVRLGAVFFLLSQTLSQRR